jgi:WD40 repeat protein
MIIVGGGAAGSSAQSACMLCSYDDSKKIADWDSEIQNKGYILAMALSVDAKTLVTGGEDKFVRVWKVNEAKQSMCPLKGHTGVVHSVSISQCGIFVASASADCDVILWNLKTQERLGRMEHKAEVNAVCFHGATSDEIISGAGNLVLVWHRNSCTIKARLEGHKGPVQCLALHPLPRCSNLVFSGSMDRTIRVWGVDENLEWKAVDENLAWTGHSAGIKALVCAPVGNGVGNFMASGRYWVYLLY